MKHLAIRLAAAAAFAAAVQACIVVPTGHSPNIGWIPPETLATVRTGATPSKRADILMMLGAPDRRWPQDRFMGYLWSESVAAVLFAAGYSVGGFTIDEKKMLLMEFDTQGALLRMGVASGIREATLESAIKAWIDAAPEGKS
jgi:hypothetical protein